jgi:hypothetical protein
MCAELWDYQDYHTAINRTINLATSPFGTAAHFLDGQPSGIAKLLYAVEYYMFHESVLKLLLAIVKIAGMCHSSPESCWCLGQAYVGVYGREFLDRVGNSARRGMEGGGADCGIYTSHKLRGIAKYA